MKHISKGNKTGLVAAIIVILLLLVGSNIYFVAQSARLSRQLVQVSTLLRETARNRTTDNEYYLRREYARIQATDDQIAALRILLASDDSGVAMAGFAEQDSRGQRLYMYFSPNVCEACLYNEMDMQDSLHVQGGFNRKVTILASKEYAQNLRAKFQERELPCDYAVVDYESLEPESILLTMNEPLLFRWEGGRARDIFVPSKSNRRYSEMYYRYVQSKTQ